MKHSYAPQLFKIGVIAVIAILVAMLLYPSDSADNTNDNDTSAPTVEYPINEYVEEDEFEDPRDSPEYDLAVERLETYYFLKMNHLSRSELLDMLVTKDKISYNVAVCAVYSAKHSFKWAAARRAKMLLQRDDDMTKTELYNKLNADCGFFESEAQFAVNELFGDD